MASNPLDQKGMAIDDQLRSWSELNVEPFDKRDVDPYTRTRVILMNGIEVESRLGLLQAESKAMTSMGAKTQELIEKVRGWLS